MPSWILDAFILIFLVLLGFWIYKTLPAYAAKKGENRADKEDAGRISYEQEHGRNLATKDDIDNIIKELEKVKAKLHMLESNGNCGSVNKPTEPHSPVKKIGFK